MIHLETRVLIIRRLTMANAVDINNLSFEYEEGAKTIDQISFSVPKGSLYSCIRS